MLVMILWRVWWLWQERSYQREVREAVGEASDDEGASISSKTPYFVTVRHGDWSTMATLPITTRSAFLTRR